MYTRRGDKGETSLFGSKRVGKDSPRVEAYGAVDELNSLLGVVISECRDPQLISELKAVQRMLFVAGADIATEDLASRRVSRITHSHTRTIETMTDRISKALPPLKNFVFPGGSRVASRLQLARAVCRRSERRVFTASRTECINTELLPFFNRLSSYLFNASRMANLKAHRREDIWKAKG